LNNDISKTQFDNLFFNEVISVLNTSSGQTEKYTIPLDQRIYVLEDIDCQSDLVMERALKEKEDKEKEKIHDKLDLSFLLNILDGVLEIPGRIVIMTSNYIEHLDHALIRPGRIDVIANFKKCVNVTLIEMIEFFYDITLSSNERDRILGLEEYMISPAEMGKIMFENFDDFRKVIVTLEKMDTQTICVNDSLDLCFKDELPCMDKTDEPDELPCMDKTDEPIKVSLVKDLKILNKEEENSKEWFKRSLIHPNPKDVVPECYNCFEMKHEENDLEPMGICNEMGYNY
jgi:hypothetical protein